MQARLFFSTARSLGVQASLFFSPATSLGVQARLFFSPARSLGVQARLFFSAARSLGVQAMLFFSPARLLYRQVTLLFLESWSFTSMGASIPLPSRGGVGVGSLSFPGSTCLILFFCPAEIEEMTLRMLGCLAQSRTKLITVDSCLPQNKTKLIALDSCLPHPCPSPHRGGEWLAPRYSSSLPLQARLFFLLTRSLAHFLLTFHLKFNLTTAWTAASFSESVHAAAACALADVRCDHSSTHFC